MIDEIFKPDFTKLNYKIIIEVYQNGHQFIIEPVAKSPESYQELIGTMEIVKSGFLDQHRQILKKESNLKEEPK